MFCIKCGTEYSEELEKCPNCEVNVDGQEESICDNTDNTSVEKNNISTFLFSMAGIIFVMSIIAACFISVGGYNISQIESVGGRTLEEAYYYYLGKVYYGMAITVFSIGVFFSSTLTYLGLKK